MLKKGMNAIDFTCLDTNNKEVKLSDYKGKKIVLYFYPKDLTGGCTTEALAFKEDFLKYKEKDVVVIGISKDSVKSHIKFIEKYDLPFILLSDEGLDAIKKYEVWGEKSLYGRKYMGVLRTTFIINEDFIITDIIEKVNVNSASKDTYCLLNLD